MDRSLREKMRRFYESDSYINEARTAALDTLEYRRSLLKKYVKSRDVVVELGANVGILEDISEFYVGLDISQNALKSIKKMKVCCDITSVPLKDSSVSIITTWHTLEHVHDVGQVLFECDRILKKDGYILLNDTWFSRPWLSTGINMIPWRKCTFSQKLQRVYILLADWKIVRALWVLPRRIFFEGVSYLFPGKLMRLRYRKLHPNYEDFIQSDSDAAASIDPHFIILWFKVRNYRLINCTNLIERLFFRKGLVVQKQK